MLYPLIPDIKHPKWVIVAKILEIIGSPRARKIAGRLKIYDVNNFLLSIKVLILSDLFERDISKLVSEINENNKLKKLLGLWFRDKCRWNLQITIKSGLWFDFSLFKNRKIES